MNNLVEAYEVLMNIAPVTNDMDEVVFAAFYCMLLEEWCKTNKADITEVIAYVSQCILEINVTMGKY